MLVAWIGSAGGVFVYDGAFSAVRSADGNWTSPSPSTNVRDLAADGFEMASPAEAAARVLGILQRGDFGSNVVADVRD